MLVPIANTPRPYAWGSRTALAGILGTPPSDEPQAELWLGAHSGSPSRIIDPSRTGGAATLEEWIAADPRAALGDAADRLPFLLKLLAADAPLSLQAHPTADQAREGFRREEEEGVPRDAAERNYKDPFPKPELIYAFSDEFEALCGFRPVDEFREEMTALRAAAGDDRAPFDLVLRRAESDASLPDLVAWLVGGGADVERLVDLVVQLSRHPLVGRLASRYPGDPGIVVALLLHHVTLRRGQALFLPAGNIHAYLEGVGVELMTASDNVLRGGLTPKHVDVPELLSVLDATVSTVPYLEPSSPAPGVLVFAPGVSDFRLVRFEGSATWTLDGPAIAVCTSGSFAVSGSSPAVALEGGAAVYVTPDEGELAVSGTGELFLATTG